MKQQPHENTEIAQLEGLARLMDSKFRIPGTSIRFGLDGLIGLIPVLGDLSTFAVSAYMLVILARNGASGFLLARMILNIAVDAVVGMIPILGAIFDIGFKANLRNMKLMREHYTEGRHTGGAWKVIVPLLVVLFILLAAVAWLIYILLDAIF